ncbi:TetR/AcrR family transcriptional regulator [Prauserella sp. PE36]|uniref:TetR/AcrR family transcriptional regulator n=1 Tax=Prauserella endophytica TaxID=1592324 RepID=A0ABY2S9I8_9PSEU|nr:MULTISPECIES: TetR/AcrR family transcriptional regulator [Prauserella]PXY29339.1 TetR family transcriptional regulator [Prauserella coralliicola]RBM20891.1 TetR/AcrR family transcriptional regulator [Prauserella sp. PE36]TKG72333.1 TetR/AcrR family transcriptional regulator [Prauserella endophytica]
MTASDSGRGAILRAARKAFARQPYAAVTLRDIAAEAGVSASLIVKHFGSKEGLFDTVADFTGAADALLAVPNAELGRHLVLTLVRYRREQGSDLLVRVVFAAGSGDERALLRERFRQQVTDRIATRLEGPDAGLRAELVVAHLLGLGAVLAVDREGLAATVNPERVADHYAPGLQALIDG